MKLFMSSNAYKMYSQALQYFAYSTEIKTDKNTLVETIN